jgi:hypothetical protein
MNNPDKYIKFIDPHDDKKYYIFEYVRGTGDMSIYRKGRVIGKKTVFDGDSQIDAPVNALKLSLYRGHKFEMFKTLEDLEGDLFMEALLDY